VNGNKKEEPPDEVMSRFGEVRESADSFDFPPFSLGQNCPQHCPQRRQHPGTESDDKTSSSQTPDPLGRPMTIREVADCLGCSAWTVRQQYLPAGLPHFRLARTGKLLFFHNQIVGWVLARQRQKGGFR
jgi:hypothetical protein